MLRAARTQGITNDMRRNRQVKYSLLWRSWQNYAAMPNDSCMKLDFFIHATSACNEIQLLVPRNLLEYRDRFSFFCSLCKQLLKTLFVNNLVPWMAILYHIASQYFETLLTPENGGREYIPLHHDPELQTWGQYEKLGRLFNPWERETVISIWKTENFLQLRDSQIFLNHFVLHNLQNSYCFQSEEPIKREALQ